MKIRIQLVTGEILRCEGVIRTHAEGRVLAVTANEDVDFPVTLCVPINQVIYAAADEVTIERLK